MDVYRDFAAAHCEGLLLKLAKERTLASREGMYQKFEMILNLDLGDDPEKAAEAPSPFRRKHLKGMSAMFASTGRRGRRVKGKGKRKASFGLTVDLTGDQEEQHVLLSMNQTSAAGGSGGSSSSSAASSSSSAARPSKKSRQ